MRPSAGEIPVVTPKHSMSDRAFSTNEALLSKLCSRDGTQSDWQAFYQQYQELIARWCVQFGVNPVDLGDIFHDILMKLLHSLPTYDAASGHRFRSWLKTIVLNALIDRLRVAENNPFPSLLADVAQLPARQRGSTGSDAPVDQLAEQLTARSTPAALILSRSRQRVTEPTWDAFVRRELLDEPVATIADAKGIKKASVYQAVSRVRAIIREESRAYFDLE